MNEVSKILNYFNKIELAKTKNVLSIKPVNLVENWENFNNDLHELFKNYPNDKLNSVYETFNTTKNIQTKYFKHLLDCKKELTENKYNQKSVTDTMPFVIEQYPFYTNINIVNWQLYKGAIINELFINEFVKLMRFRLNYIETAIKFIKDTIKEIEPNYKDVETSATINELEKQPIRVVNVAYQHEVINRFNIEIESHYTRHKKNKPQNFDVKLKNEFSMYQIYLRDVLNTEITFEIIDNNINAKGIEAFYNHNTGKKLDALKQIKKSELIAKNEDLEFINGTNDFIETFNGFVIVSKNGIDKEFTTDNYFNLLLENYNNEIENSQTHENTLLILSNSILHFNKCMLHFVTQPNVKPIIQSGIDYLENYKRNLIPFETLASKPTVNVEPENKYSKVFKNGYAYQMFLELKKLTVDKNPLADYAFIFFKLSDEKIGAINNTVTHPIFIEFLNKEFKAGIEAIKFPFKNQQNKQQTYNTILDKYKANL